MHNEVIEKCQHSLRIDWINLQVQFNSTQR